MLRGIFLLRFGGHGQMSSITSFNFYLYLLPTPQTIFSTSHVQSFYLEDWERGRWGDTSKRYVGLFLSFGGKGIQTKGTVIFLPLFRGRSGTIMGGGKWRGGFNTVAEEEDLGAMMV